MPQASARQLARTALREWRTSRRFADLILQDLIAASRLTASDRAFVVELSYGVLRNLTLLDFWTGQLRHGAIDADSRDLVRLGLYQLFLLQTPEHAAIFETVQLARPKQRAFTNAILRAAQRQKNELETATRKQPLSIQTSHPAFLIDRWKKQFGDETARALCEWNNRPAPVHARVNRLKISPEKFLLAYPAGSRLDDHPDFVRLDHPAEALEQGLCYVQDPGTMRACQLLDPQPADNVLDACAAPGGKTAFIAQLMENHGSITACDRDPARIERLTENLNRLGVRNTTILQRNWTEPGQAGSTAQFERILLDAPCSNTGVMRRRVDLRWRLTPADFGRMQAKQLALARNLIPLLKVSGVFVYSTCSLEPEENDQVVERIQQEFPQLERVEKDFITPFQHGFDGAFAAKFVRRT